MALTNQWVVLALNSKSEGEDPEILRKSISNALRGVEVYVPAVVSQIGNDRVVRYLVDGYAFALRSRPDADYLRLSTSNRYVSSILTQGFGSNRTLATVTDKEIDEFRRQARVEADQGIGVGDRVLILSGPYRNIQANVVEDIPEKRSVQVHICLRSKQSIVTLPRSFLQLVRKAPPTAFLTRVRRLKAWAQNARAVYAWSGDTLVSVRDKYREFSRISRFRSRLQASELLSVIESPLDMMPAALLLQRWYLLGRWTRQLGVLRDGIPDLDLVPLRNAFRRWTWCSDVCGRWKHLTEDNMISNIIVDGHNMAFRALYAPGTQDLADSKGRPTGALYAFLRSLGALRKRFHDAVFFVCWDGSSQRRKALYPEYKANRKAHQPVEFDQVAYLREKLLPQLGIVQAYNPQEEADDVIGTMVRGPLEDHRNVIVSTDRDFLQLVSRNTVLLVPSVGGRKEIMFDPDLVEHEYQVPPEKMVCFRALVGDSSDNLPGVGRIPKKILASLVRSHDTVDGIFSSGLAGVTRKQYERLREAENRVKLNVGLMTIRTNVDVHVVDPAEDWDAARQHLEDVDVNPEDFLETFLRPSTGFLKGGSRAK